MKRPKKEPRCLLLDWGDTLMRVFTDAEGPMFTWSRVAVVPGIEEAIRVAAQREAEAVAQRVAADPIHEELALLKPMVSGQL